MKTKITVSTCNICNAIQIAPYPLPDKPFEIEEKQIPEPHNCHAEQSPACLSCNPNNLHHVTVEMRPITMRLYHSTTDKAYYLQIIEGEEQHPPLPLTEAFAIHLSSKNIEFIQTEKTFR